MKPDIILRDDDIKETITPTQRTLQGNQPAGLSEVVRTSSEDLGVEWAEEMRFMNHV